MEENIKSRINRAIQQYDEACQRVDSNKEKAREEREEIQRTTNMLELVSSISDKVAIAIIVFMVLSLISMFEKAPVQMMVFAFVCIIVAYLLIVLTDAFVQMEWIKNQEWKTQLEKEFPSDEWIRAFHQVEQTFRQIDNGKFQLVDIDEKGQKMLPILKTQADNKKGMQSSITISAEDGTPFLQSICGENGLSASKYILLEGSVEDAEEAQKLTQAQQRMPENIEAGYTKVTMFPTLKLNPKWTFLVPAQDGECVKKIFENICRSVLYDIIRMKLEYKLQEHCEHWENSVKISQSELSPYFTDRKDHRPWIAKDLEKMFSDVSELIQDEKHREILKDLYRTLLENGENL